MLSAFIQTLVKNATMGVKCTITSLQNELFESENQTNLMTHDAVTIENVLGTENVQLNRPQS
jgi:hypothetical protein